MQTHFVPAELGPPGRFRFRTPVSEITSKVPFTNKETGPERPSHLASAKSSAFPPSTPCMPSLIFFIICSKLSGTPPSWPAALRAWFSGSEPRLVLSLCGFPNHPTGKTERFCEREHACATNPTRGPSRPKGFRNQVLIPFHSKHSATLFAFGWLSEGRSSGWQQPGLHAPSGGPRRRGPELWPNPKNFTVWRPPPQSIQPSRGLQCSLGLLPGPRFR